MPGVQVDGNDVIGVRAVMEAALDRARGGDGATVVEALTYRLSDHTTADDATRYRPRRRARGGLDEIEPLLRTRRYPRDLRLLGRRARSRRCATQCSQQIDAAVQATSRARTPAPMRCSITCSRIRRPGSPSSARPRAAIRSATRTGRH